MRNTLLAAVATAAFAFTVAACQPQAPQTEETPVAEAPAPEVPAAVDIVATAQNAGTFTTLAGLLTQANLVADLQGAGPFTVFAPTDEAFAKVDAKALEALKADPAKLAAVLKHHVVAGETLSSAIAEGKTEVDTLAGDKLAIEKAADGTVTVGGARVTQADVDASNGVIHVVDAVILPAAK